MRLLLELGKGLYSAVIDMAASVKDNFCDSVRKSALGNELADCLSSILVPCALYVVKFVLYGRCRYKRMSLFVVDDLSRDVLQAAEDCKTGALTGAGDPAFRYDCDY